jgi:hypothetical protein
MRIVLPMNEVSLKNKKIVREDTVTLIVVILIGALIIFVMNLFIFDIL